MSEKKKSRWALLNPFEWLHAALLLFAAIFAPILRLLGMIPPPSTEGFEDIRKEDVDDAAKLAQEQEAAVDAIRKQMSPGAVVREYARADAIGRSGMDLSVLNFSQQDWLMTLPEEDLGRLGMSTTSACAKSLEAQEVKPSYAKKKPGTEAPEILSTPSAEEIEEMKREFVSARFRELFHVPGVASSNTRYTPSTIH